MSSADRRAPKGPVLDARHAAPAASPEAAGPAIHPVGSRLEQARTDRDPISAAVFRSLERLLSDQRDDGHWIYEFEADCTIPSEYLLLQYRLGHAGTEHFPRALEQKLANYVRVRQEGDGWPLYHGGASDISGTVKAYWALKVAGDDPDAPHMTRARDWILAQGGAARVNGFTRSLMARAGLAPWSAAPFVPIEIVLLPRWLPVHFSRMSYWARAVVVPMAVVHSLKPEPLESSVRIDELFVQDPFEERHWGEPASWLERRFAEIERLARHAEKMIPRKLRRRALRFAEGWFTERLNGLDGLGGVFPSMVNVVEALHALGHGDDERTRTAEQALQLLLVERDGEAYCQPCVSPVWDTALAALAVEATRELVGDEERIAVDGALTAAGDWLRDRQVLDGPGDWRAACPELAPGGWAFQYNNAHYPDIDDACAVLWALVELDRERYAHAITRGTDWVAGMQSSNGGFGAFDVDNDSAFLQAIPVGDSGPLLDPPSADVSGRAALVFSLLGRPHDDEARRSAVEYLLDEQEESGSWFGRWGTNYVYGCWSVMTGLGVARTRDGSDLDLRIEQAQRRAVAWLASVQRDDGGFGETNDSYADPRLAGKGQESTSYQTAWAMLAILSTDDPNTEVLERAAAYLVRTQRADGSWADPYFSAPGFPEIFYLRYTGYSSYFPHWALARYRRAILV